MYSNFIFNRRIKRKILFSFFFLSVIFVSFLYIDAKEIKAAPPWTQIQVCVDPPEANVDDYQKPVIYWTTSGNNMNKYQLQVSALLNFSGPILYDTGEVTVSPPSPPGTYSKQIPTDLLPGDKTYYYRIKVKDGQGWTDGWAVGTFTLIIPNFPPIASNLKVTPPDYCVSGPAAFFSWNFFDPEGTSQLAYQVQVDNNPDFSSPEINSGKVTSSFGYYSATALAYNNTYNWRLMVWDSNNLASSWTTGPSFSTPVHAYPTSNFSWFPNIPILGQDTLFSDKSKAYGGATISNWYWTIPDATYISPSSQTDQNPVVKFISEGNKNVVLRVTDSNGFVCSIVKTVGAQLPLPCWKETNPH